MFFLPNLSFCLLAWLLASSPCRSHSHTASFLVLHSCFPPSPFPPPLQSHRCQIPFSNLFFPLSHFHFCAYYVDHEILVCGASLQGSVLLRLSTLCWPGPNYTEPLREESREKTHCCLWAGSGAQVIQKCCADFKCLQQGVAFLQTLTLEP